ncbi:hypothetical protein Tco_0027870 [Tanacetum coccineum]
MASQDARLSKFEAYFQQQQSKMTNKINTVLKAITDRIAGTLSSDTVKNLKLGTHAFSSARSYPIMDPQCSTQIHSSINTITIHPKQQRDSRDDKTEENEEEKRNSLENHSDSSTPPDPSIAFITEKFLGMKRISDKRTKNQAKTDKNRARNGKAWKSQRPKSQSQSQIEAKD